MLERGVGMLVFKPSKYPKSKQSIASLRKTHLGTFVTRDLLASIRVRRKSTNDLVRILLRHTKFEQLGNPNYLSSPSRGKN